MKRKIRRNTILSIFVVLALFLSGRFVYYNWVLERSEVTVVHIYEDGQLILASRGYSENLEDAELYFSYENLPDGVKAGDRIEIFSTGLA